MNRVLRVVAAALVASSGLALLRPPPAAACTCAAPASSDVGEALDDADAAFVGVYRGRNDPFGADPEASSARTVINQFDVERVLKGDIGETVVVASAAEPASCGLSPRPGEQVGLLLTRAGGGWRSGLCESVDPGKLKAAASRLSGTEVLAAVVAGMALIGVIAATALGPGRAATRG